jgi:ferric-dicitrate binding protein FerR (iron transport regulator)
MSALFDIFHAARLAAHQKVGILSRKEKAELDRWQDASPQHEEWFDVLQDDDTFWDKVDDFAVFEERAGEEWVRMCAQMAARRRNRRRRRVWIGIAASLVIAIGCYWGSGGSTADYRTIVTAPRQTIHLQLPDGTGIWLDASSMLRYPVKFVRATREVELSGQAYLEIAHQPIPFIIHAGKTDIQDLGTALTICCYPGSVGVVTVLQGSVRIGTCVLRAGQQIAIPTADASRPAPVIDTAEAMAWKQGFFHYTDASLSSILLDIAHWYGIRIINNLRGSRRYTFSIPRSVSLPVLLHGLGVDQYHFQGKTLVLGA